MVAARIILAVAALPLLLGAGACSSGDDGTAGGTEGAVSTVATDATVPTTTLATTTSAPDAVESLIDEQLAVDFSQVEPLGVQLEGSDALVGGSPNTVAARSVRANLEGAGLDLTGMSFHVLPVSGTGDRLLVIETTDDTVLSAGDPAGGEEFVTRIVEQMQAWGITQLVLNYSGEDAQGPLVITLTASRGDLDAVISEGADISSAAKVQIVRPTS